MFTADSFAYVIDSNMVTVFLDGIFVGFMSWKNNVVIHISVREPYRRNGVATRMFELAKDKCPSLCHSKNLTDDGVLFVKSFR